MFYFACLSYVDEPAAQRPSQDYKKTIQRPSNDYAKTLLGDRPEYTKRLPIALTGSLSFFNSQNKKSVSYTQTNLLKNCLRKERDSNPRTLAGQRFSRPPRSTTPPSFLCLFFVPPLFLRCFSYVSPLLFPCYSLVYPMFLRCSFGVASGVVGV